MIIKVLVSQGTMQGTCLGHPTGNLTGSVVDWVLGATTSIVANLLFFPSMPPAITNLLLKMTDPVAVYPLAVFRSDSTFHEPFSFKE